MQAKHRMEEATARDRVRERKQLTRRLIQEGALLESVYPQCTEMELDTLKAELKARFASSPQGLPSSRKGALIHHCFAAVVSPAGLVRSLRRGAGCGVADASTDFQSKKRLLLPVGSNRFPFSNPYAFIRARSKAWGRELRLDERRKDGGENEWQFTIWKRRS